MKNLIRITMLLAFIVLTKANVCGQTDTTAILLEFTTNVRIGTGNDIFIPHFYNDKENGKLTVLVNTTQDGVFTLIVNDNTKKSENKKAEITFDINKGDTIRITLKGIKNGEGYGIIAKLTYNPNTGINENILTKELQLYSYDNNVVLVNQNSPKNLTVDIYTLTGQLVKTEQINGLYDKIDLQTNLPKGIYVVRVNDGINQLSKKLSINQ